MTLRCKIVHFVGLYFLHNAHQIAGIAQIAVMQNKMPSIGVRILIQMINAISVEQRGTPLDSVHLVALTQKKLCKISPILPGYAGYKRFFHNI